MTRFGFDAVVFGLQRFGGVSTYCWELMWRMARDHGDDLTVTMPQKQLGSRWGDVAGLSRQVMTEKIPTRVARYLNCANDSSILVSSYYRLAAGRQRLVVPVYDFMYERYRSGLARTVHSWQKRKACESAAAMLCISHSTRTDLLDHYPNIDPARVHVTHLAVDHGRFYPEPDAVPALHDSLLFVGQRAGYKRFDLAVETARACGKKLAIIGPVLTAEEKTMLQDRLADRWFPYAAPDEASMRRAYSSAFALLYPSDYEGFGLPLLEAQACGSPTIAAYSSSLPEVGGEATLFAVQQKVDDYAGLVLQLGDESVRERMKLAGLDNAKAFQWNRTYAATMKMIGSLI